MVVICATIRAASGKDDELIAMMKDLAAKVLENEEGALDYRFHRSQKDPSMFMVYERYASPEAMQAHMSSPHFQEASKKFGGLVEGGLGLEVYEVVE